MAKRSKRPQGADTLYSLSRGKSRTSRTNTPGVGADHLYSRSHTANAPMGADTLGPRSRAHGGVHEIYSRSAANAPMGADTLGPRSRAHGGVHEIYSRSATNAPMGADTLGPRRSTAEIDREIDARVRGFKKR